MSFSPAGTDVADTIYGMDEKKRTIQTLNTSTRTRSGSHSFYQKAL
jgi:hypothetical protein